MGIIINTLRCVEFLADQSPEVASRFMMQGRLLDAPRGQVFWRAGQSPQGIVVPISGELAAVASSAVGREICHAFIGPGECAGFPCALDGLPHSEDVRVIRPGEFFVLGREALLRFIGAHAAVRSGVYATVGRLFRRSLQELDRTVFLPLPARLAWFLLERACVRQADGARILLRETHTELAVRLGSVREVVARALTIFAAHGLVRSTSHGMFVTDWAGLGAVAGRANDDASCHACAREGADLRTRRYFLSVLDRGPGPVADEMQVCGEHLTNCAACAASGCPLALAARDGAKVRHARADVAGATAARNVARSPGGPAAHESGAPARPTCDGLDGESQRDPACRARHPLPPEDVYERTARDVQTIRRRVTSYRQRVSEIESAFGDEERVPPTVSLFDDAAPAEPRTGSRGEPDSPAPLRARPRRSAG